MKILGFGLIGILIISMGTFSYSQSDNDPELTVKTNNSNYDEEPTVELISEVKTPQETLEETNLKVEELSEKVEKSIDEQISIKMDEESIQNLFGILPYLGIIIAGAIGGIILIKIRNKGKDDELSEDYEYDEESEEDFVTENEPISKLSDMYDPQSFIPDEIQLDKIIENKLYIISKLQEHKIGDNEKLNAIKKSLIGDGSFTQEENEYLNTKYEEYQKTGKNKT